MLARMVGDLRDVFELNVGEFLVEQIPRARLPRHDCILWRRLRGSSHLVPRERSIETAARTL